MTIDTFASLTTDEVRRYMSQKKESDYLLVDVRQAAEYRQGHIPGARLIPLDELEERLTDLPRDRDIIFYCRSGARSQAASVLAASGPHAHKNVLNMAGGIMAWNGQTLSDFPRLQLFDKLQQPADLLFKSMDLEKGAWRFYSHVSATYGSQPFAPTIAGLEKIELAHARKIYGIWQPMTGSKTSFEDLFDSLSGDIMEGGEDLQTAIERLEGLAQDVCLTLMEMAMSVEVSAYDLYRTLANLAEQNETRDIFLSIAQAEKEHMRVLAKAVSQC